MTPKFDELYKSLLVEMPDIDYHYPTTSYLDGDNTEYFDMVLDEDTFITKFNNLDVYKSETSSNKTDYNFLDIASKTIAAKLVISKDASIDTMWKHRSYEKDLMLNIIINFALKIYPYIKSSDRQSPQAKKFWEKLISYGISNNFKCSYVDSDGEYIVQNIEDFEQLKDYIWPNNEIVLKIYTK